jgi:hypothetical protein
MKHKALQQTKLTNQRTSLLVCLLDLLLDLGGLKPSNNKGFKTYLTREIPILNERDSRAQLTKRGFLTIHVKLVII